MDEQKFFKCQHCGNFLGLINNAGVPMICCGDKMVELIPNQGDASQEKHIPQVCIEGDTLTITVGSLTHPSLEKHHIEFIYLQTENGGQRKSLPVEKDPVVKFKVIDDKALNVFSYCNIHGLWKAKIN